MSTLTKAQSAKPGWYKTVAVCARWLFFLGSMFFLIYFAHGMTQEYSLENMYSEPALLGTGAAVLIISLASVAAAAGWSFLLAGLSCRVTFRGASAVYFSTQIAKYLPGNVGHYIGRVTLAKTRLGVPSTSAILSLMQETALACLSAVLLGLSCYFFFPNQTPGSWSRVTLYSTFALIVAASISVLVLADAWRKRGARLAFRSGKIVGMLTKTLRIVPQLKTALRTLPFYTLGYICIGIAASVVASSVIQIHSPDAVFITGAYSLAWVVGFLVPGAPGGLGVRESALVLLLASTYPKDTVLLIALLARLASVGSDLLMFIVGMFLLRMINDHQT